MNNTSDEKVIVIVIVIVIVTVITPEATMMKSSMFHASCSYCLLVLLLSITYCVPPIVTITIISSGN